MRQYDIRGTISNKQAILWNVIGVVSLFLTWFVLSYALSTERISWIKTDQLEIKDKRYFISDSLFEAHQDTLFLLSGEELQIFGLEKKRVYIVPSPIDIIKSFPELHYQDYLIVNTGKSIYLNMMGYLVAILLAFPIGLMLGLNPYVRAAFQKVFDASRFVPLTAVTGIFIIWFGLGNAMKIYFLAFGILVYLIPVVVQRINELDDVYLMTAFTLGAKKWQVVRTVLIPYVTSRLIDDIRVLTAISWTYITIAEMLNRSGGIGELIWLARRQGKIDKSFAVLVVIILIGIVQDRIFKYLDKKLFPHKYQNN